jgi:hypothetical protein
MVTAPLVKIMLAVTALVLSLSAVAGSLSFRLTLSGSELTVINQGDSSPVSPFSSMKRQASANGSRRVEMA